MSSKALLLFGILAATMVEDGVSSYCTLQRKRHGRMPLTEEELEILLELEGKEKKKYIKELKRKYAGGAK